MGASASVSGNSTLLFIWNSGQSHTIYNLAPGFYILTVTDFLIVKNLIQ